jgi:uncharacterized cupredoxin-like copper-binding protein
MLRERWSVNLLLAVGMCLVLAGCVARPKSSPSPAVSVTPTSLPTRPASSPSLRPTATINAVLTSTAAPQSLEATSATQTAAATSATQPSEVPTSAPSGGPIGVPPTGTAIYLSEWSVGLPTSLPAGQVNFAITNIGTIQHELLVFKTDLPPASIPVDSKGDVIPDGPGLTLVSSVPPLDPGQTVTQTVDLTQPGTYVFVCNMPGHFKAGMYRVITVTSSSQEQAFVPAALSEWRVAVPGTIKAGSVVMETGNFGTIQHELLVFKSDLPASGFPLDANGNIIEDGPGINLVSDGDNLDPGTTQTRTVDLTQPGAYVFLCNIPGHFKAGMYAPVTVTP